MDEGDKDQLRGGGQGTPGGPPPADLSQGIDPGDVNNALNGVGVIATPEAGGPAQAIPDAARSENSGAEVATPSVGEPAGDTGPSRLSPGIEAGFARILGERGDTGGPSGPSFWDRLRRRGPADKPSEQPPVAVRPEGAGEAEKTFQKRVVEVAKDVMDRLGKGARGVLPGRKGKEIGLAVPDPRVEKATNKVLQRIKEHRIFKNPLDVLVQTAKGAWDHKTDIVIGAAAGAAVRLVVRVSLGTAGLGVAPVVGAVGGALAAGVKDVIREQRLYDKFRKVKMDGKERISKELFSDLMGGAIRAREQTADKGKKERHGDDIRHLSIMMKRQEGEHSLSFLVGELVKGHQTDADKLTKEIIDAKLIDRRRLVKALLWGAAAGVVGGAISETVHGLFAGQSVDTGAVGLRPGVTPDVTQAPGGPQPDITSATEAPAPVGAVRAVTSEGAQTLPPVPEPTGVPVADAAPPGGGPATTGAPAEASAPRVPQPEIPETKEPFTFKPSEPGVGTEGTQTGVPGAPETITLSPEVAEAIRTLPDINLPAGSNPWAEVSKVLRGVLGGEEPTADQIREVTEQVAKDSGISVPEWGLTAGINDRSLPPGFSLKFTLAAKTLIQGMIKK